jgi:hypothetical protein
VGGGEVASHFYNSAGAVAMHRRTHRVPLSRSWLGIGLARTNGTGPLRQAILKLLPSAYTDLAGTVQICRAGSYTTAYLSRETVHRRLEEIEHERRQKEKK